MSEGEETYSNWGVEVLYVGFLYEDLFCFVAKFTYFGLFEKLAAL